MMCTLRKNKPPAGSIMRCEPESVFSSRPSLNHWMDGVGLPSALQLKVNGSFFGTVVSMGCSMMRGFSPGMERGRKRFYYYFFYFLAVDAFTFKSNPTLRLPLEGVLYFIWKGEGKGSSNP